MTLIFNIFGGKALVNELRSLLFNMAELDMRLTKFISVLVYFKKRLVSAL